MSLRLPPICYLPAGVSLHPTEVRTAVGPMTRVGLKFWRDNHGFPKPYGRNNSSYYMSRDVADWLESRGVEIRWL